MTQATVTSRAPLSKLTAVDTAIDAVSGVSWAAVFAGAFVAAMRYGKVFLEEHFGTYCNRTERTAP